ncbi:MAG: Nif3-like dinuclear metal center hexameric protein [Bacteroidia bacterium]
MKIRDIAEVLEEWAPLPVAESYDNVGLLVGNEHAEVTGVLVSLDVTEAVVNEAAMLGINLIVAHHPIWFSARKRLNGEDYVSRTIISAIKKDIAIYACHTNLDHVHSGVNQKICDRLDLRDTRFLQKKTVFNEESYGAGMIGNLAEPLSKTDFLAKVKSAFHCGGIRYADTDKTFIGKVAVCGGAGSFLTQEAIRQNADALVTADITYHKFFDNEEKILLLDIGHYESEQYTSVLIRDYLSEKFINFAIRLSEVITNPVRYF